MNRILANAFNQHYFISQEGAAANLPLLIGLMKGNFQKMDFSGNRKSNRIYFLSGSTYEISEYGQAKSPEKAPENSIAVIPVFDVITKSDQECGPSGTDTKKKILTRCGANPNITGIILHISSPGGEAFASLDFYKAILDFKAKYNKSVIAYIDDYGCSGAQYIAAACDKIICSDEITQVGSIGVVNHIIDQIKTLENEGIVLREIYATESSEKNIEVREALNGNDKPLLQRATTLVNRFVADVKSGRPTITTDIIDPFKGKTLFAKEALKIGLIDEIGNIQTCVSHINSINSNNQQTNSIMSIPFKPTWKVISSIFSSKKEGEVLTTTDVDTVDSELVTRNETIARLTSELEAANTAKADAEAAQALVSTSLAETKDSLKTAEDSLAATKLSLVAAESQLTGATEALNAIDATVEEAVSVSDKIAAVTVLLAAKPGVKPSGTKTEEDTIASADGVDWETMNALPHMQ